MGQIALYSQDTGVPVVLVPTPGALTEYTATEIALKDTPTGKPFWMVDVEDVPKDYTFFNAWELDTEALGKPTGYGMDYEDWVREIKEVKYPTQSIVIEEGE
jgi:hypothetical protein